MSVQSVSFHTCAPHPAACVTLQISLAAVGRDTAELRRRLEETARRIVEQTAPEPPHLRFHELRLPALIEELRHAAAGCEHVAVNSVPAQTGILVPVA